MTKHNLNRRDFVKQVSTGSLIAGLHPIVSFNTSLPNPLNKPNPKKRAYLIESIQLLTHAPFEVMKKFYMDKLGFNLLSEQKDELIFKAGMSSIVFKQAPSEMNNPWYHFAFNIPENKLLKAREWLLERSPIIPTPKRARDPDFPDDVRHFPHWNAHSLFFWDPAGNLLEFIARHDLKNGSSGNFSEVDIINVSEIAFVVDDQVKNAQMLNEELGLPEYPIGSNFWWAMGDEHGLLLCIPKRVWGENTPNPKTFEIFPTQTKIVGSPTKILKFDQYPYIVEV